MCKYPTIYTTTMLMSCSGAGACFTRARALEAIEAAEAQLGEVVMINAEADLIEFTNEGHALEWAAYGLDDEGEEPPIQPDTNRVLEFIYA